MPVLSESRQPVIPAIIAAQIRPYYINGGSRRTVRAEFAPMQEAIEQFRAAIHKAGLNPPTVIEPDGKLHRFASNGKRNDDAGWYVFHDDDIPAGAFGDWRGGLSKTWRADIGRTLSPQEEATYRARVEAIRRERGAEDAKHMAEASGRAAAIWKAAQPASDDHPYLINKGVKAHGLRVRDGTLVIPIRDHTELTSLQFIGTEGEKRFLTGGRVGGCYFPIGKLEDALCIAEGYATGASIYEATGHAVAVAFNDGNLLPVAQSLRTKYPNLRLIVCSDDDARTRGNPGLRKAREAALAVGALLAVPDFGSNRPDDATDFNDLYCHAGPDAVCAIIERAAPAESGGDENRNVWPEPKPIIAELKPVPAFDTDTLLPDVLRAWIIDEAERMPCPPDFIAAAALAALGSIIGARCAIKPKARDSWMIIPNLWGGIVGDPSAKKSPAWGAALKPLDRLIAKALERHAASLADYQTAKVVFEAHKDAIESRIKEAARKPTKGDPTSIARELRTHGEQAPDAPTLRRYKTNDSTVEKLGELLRENPAGLLVLRDELVGLIATWEREGREGERAFFLEGWNGNQSFDTDRIGRGHISIPNLCISIFGGIQPDKLTVYLEQAVHTLANDGMLQRFQVLVYPDARQWEWRDRSPDKRARDAAFAVFEKLADFDPLAWGAAPADDFAKFPYFCFSDDAQRIFIEWSADLHRERIPAEDEPIIRQHLAKYDKLFPALALIFHLVDCAAGSIRDRVGRDAALRAAAWCEYLEAHARRCYGLLKDDGLRSAQALAAKLECGALDGGFTLRDVRRNQWRSLTTDNEIQAALDWLEDEDWLRGEATGGTGPGSGRRTIRYGINSAVNARCKQDRNAA
jgi:putative DNA primase/helicase